MKKSIPMRAAGALFIGVMLTASIVSGSFAKYVTQDSSYDEARVAKFGVVASISGDLFGDSYAATTDDTVQAWSLHNPTVASATQKDDVVAPGTKSKKNMTIKVTGKPEVSTQITLDNFVVTKEGTDKNKIVADSDIVLKKGDYGVMVEYTGDYTEDTIASYYVVDADNKQYKAATAEDMKTADLKVYQLKDAAAADEAYKPLKWTVTNKNGDVTDCADITAVKAAIRFNGEAATPNTALDDSFVIGWEWPFETGDQDTATKLYANDGKDTILGDMMADDGDNNYQVVKKNGDNYDVVKYTKVNADTNSANMVKIAYTGDSGTLENACAVLTVTFSTRLTVTQVD